jgi:hypothetical protein
LACTNSIDGQPKVIEDFLDVGSASLKEDVTLSKPLLVTTLPPIAPMLLGGVLVTMYATAGVASPS